MTKRKSPEELAAAKTRQKLDAMPTGQDSVPAGPRSRNSVTVACKLPHGLILRVFTHIEVARPVMGGGTVIEKIAQQEGPSVTIKGNAVPHGVAPNHQITGGYGLTPNVDADFFAKWLKQNADSDVVKNNLIFAQETLARAADQAKEQKALRSGLERIDVSKGTKDPRMLKGVKKFDPNDKVDEEEAA